MPVLATSSPGKQSSPRVSNWWPKHHFFPSWRLSWPYFEFASGLDPPGIRILRWLHHRAARWWVSRRWIHAKKRKKEKSLWNRLPAGVTITCRNLYTNHQQPAVTVTAGVFVSSSVCGMSTLVLWERVNISASGDTCSQVFRLGGEGVGVRLASGQTATYL